jgi:hypothetical protein
MQSFWTREQAIWFCTELEKITPSFGIHVALGGGCLYKIPVRDERAQRKDVDVILYRIREHSEMNIRGLFSFLVGTKLDIMRKPYSQREDWWTSFVIKAAFRGRDIDFLVPENGRGRSYDRPGPLEHARGIVETIADDIARRDP